MKAKLIVGILSLFVFNNANAVDAYWNLAEYNNVLPSNTMPNSTASKKGIYGLINQADQFGFTTEEVITLNKAANGSLKGEAIEQSDEIRKIINELKKHSIEIDLKKNLNLGELVESEYNYIHSRNQLAGSDSDANNLIKVLSKVSNNTSNTYKNKIDEVNENIHLIGNRALGCQGCGLTKTQQFWLGVSNGIDSSNSALIEAFVDSGTDAVRAVKPAWKISRATFFQIPGEKFLKKIGKVNDVKNAVAIAGDIGDITNALFELAKSVKKTSGDPSAANIWSAVTSSEEILFRLTETITVLEDQHDQFEAAGGAMAKTESLTNVITGLSSLKSKVEDLRDLYRNSYQEVSKLPNSNYKTNLEYYNRIAENIIYKDIWNDSNKVLASSLGLVGQDRAQGLVDAFNEGLNYVFLETTLDTQRKTLVKKQEFYQKNTNKIREGIDSINYEFLVAGQVWADKIQNDKDAQELIDFSVRTLEKGNKKFQDYIGVILNQDSSHIDSSSIHFVDIPEANIQDKAYEKILISDDSTKLTTPYQQSVLKQDLTIVAGDWEVTQGDPSVHLSIGDSFGSITAPNSNQIAALNNAGVPVTTMSRTYEVPNGVNNISTSFLANFVTNEYPEFVGTEFNDSVAIDVVTGSGNSYSVRPFTQELNSANLTAVSGLPNPMIDTGGQTGFQSVNVEDIPVANGGKIRIDVTSINAGDDLYPSAILINDTTVKN